jgi:cholesterol transport system auxiliary component
MKRMALALTAAALCAGCIGSGSSSQGERPETYRLSAPEVAAAGGSPLSTALAVARPRAAPALDSSSLAISRPGQEFGYYSGVRWAEPAPSMLQQLLVQALADTGIYATVVAAPSRVPTEQMLDVELRRFEAVGRGETAPQVVVELQATLLDTKRGVRLTSVVAEGQATATENRRAAVVEAWQQATSAAVIEAVTKIRDAAVAASASGGAK